MATTVVIPDDSQDNNRAATEAYGAAVIDYDPQTASREEIARRLEAVHGFTMIPPYDHEDVIAGQGTAALELIETQNALDALLVPCGGGGLLSGSAVAV